MNGAARIAAERQRQIDVEGWTPEHDAEHDGPELVRAAAAYLVASVAPYPETVPPPPQWPWEASWWKPSADRARNLDKAGALIAAEIDRLVVQGKAAGRG